MKNLDGKVAAVTGAASGLGRAMALAFAREGMHVALADIDERGLLSTCEEARALGVGTSAVSLLVTGVFYSGFDEYDRRLMYTSLADTQELLGRGDQVMGVELKVRGVDRADEQLILDTRVDLQDLRVVLEHLIEVVLGVELPHPIQG